MDPYYLLKEELEFELQSRGVPIKGNVDLLKKLLKELLITEQSGLVNYEIKAPRQVLASPEAELKHCKSKLTTLATYINEITEKPDRHLFKRLVSRLYHVKNRLELISSGNAAEDNIKVELSTRCQMLLDKLEAKDDAEVQKDEITPEIKQLLHETLGEVGDNIVKKLQIDTEENSDKMRPKLFKTSTLDIDTPKRKLVPISQWGVYFSADNKVSVNAFIERVNEIKEARNATDEDLWRYAIDFFKGDALIWFRANKVQATNWKELVVLLKRTFQSPFYQDDLLAEIKARTQGKDESIAIYMSTLQNMFNRLPLPITEQEKISIILRNIQPYYQRAICRDVFFSVAEIVEVLRIVERTKINCDRFEEPKSHTINLEPDLAYKNNSLPGTSKNVNEVSAKIEIDNVTTSAQRLITGRCWNCREVGHLFRSCSVPKQRLFCYKCGRFGVTSKDCVCKGNATGESMNPAK
ncbi:uncharacterized protein LOC135116895 [Helicoverpa armigera]|uniref:uncharacterized protein LOC135116895 n=1 Tax=Helicoverpa armigera TaxID=29058 RepID=UPI003082CC49